MTATPNGKTFWLTDLYPKVTTERFERLVESIRAHGLRQPITLLPDGTLLDGRHRLHACEKAGVEPRFEVYGGDDPEAYVDDSNERRDMTIAERAFLAADREAHYAAEAKQRQREHGQTAPGKPQSLGAPVHQVIERVPKAADQAAESVGGVSGRSVAQAKRIREKAPDLETEIRAGRLTLKSADKEVARRERAGAVPKAEPQPKVEAVTTKLHLLNGATMDVNKPKGKSTFNPVNEHISWAEWSWNPVTGCLHGCDYCYARAIAHPASAAFPAAFEPALRPERLTAPANSSLPRNASPKSRRVFVCSMADLFGEWVPQEWIEQVFDAANKAPDWTYLFLTKFPQRYKRLPFPPDAWAGTSVDTQSRVRIAERSMKAFDASVKWLSIEPLLEPLHFDDLSWCDWMVIGSQTATRQPEHASPEFAPPIEWVFDLIAQARAANVPIYLKPNLVGVTNPQSPGMVLTQESPRGITL